MIGLDLILLGIIVLFTLLIGWRLLSTVKICTLCGAVSGAWIILFILSYFGSYVDPLIIGILMGGSIVGVIYLLEPILPADFQIFKLPFFLTLVTVTYLVLNRSFELAVVIILALLWIFLAVVYMGRNNAQFRSLGKKIIDCCKNW